MTYEIIFNNDYCTVRYNSDFNYIYHTVHRPIGGKPFQDVLNAGLDKLVETGSTKWLSDDRLNAEFSPDDIQFAVEDWGPRAAHAGWKFWALVVPKDTAGRASMTQIIQVFWQLGVRVRIFTDLDDASNWLENQ